MCTQKSHRYVCVDIYAENTISLTHTKYKVPGLLVVWCVDREYAAHPIPDFLYLPVSLSFLHSSIALVRFPGPLAANTWGQKHRHTTQRDIQIHLTFICSHTDQHIHQESINILTHSRH